MKVTAKCAKHETNLEYDPDVEAAIDPVITTLKAYGPWEFDLNGNAFACPTAIAEAHDADEEVWVGARLYCQDSWYFELEVTQWQFETWPFVKPTPKSVTLEVK